MRFSIITSLDRMAPRGATGLCPPGLAAGRTDGGVAEWFKASRLKRDDRKVRGFESYPLRHALDRATRTRTYRYRFSRGEVAERPKATAC